MPKAELDLRLHRLLLFSDGVYAIAVTLLAVELLLLVLVASVRCTLRRPLVLLIKGEIELQHHVQGYTSEAQYPGAPAKGVGIRQRQNQVGGVGASGSQEPASRGLPPQDGSQDSQPQGGVPSPQPASKA